MRIVGVNGSGRVDGNTAVLVRAVLQGAAERGAQATLLQLGRMQIAGCNSCKACKADQRCVIRDDMDRAYEVLPEADVLMLATPIYLDHVTAQTKAFIDRLYCYLGLNLENHYPNKAARVALGITYGAGGGDTYAFVTDWMKERFRFYFDLPTIATLTIDSTSFSPLIDGGHPVVRAAHEFGRSLA